MAVLMRHKLPKIAALLLLGLLPWLQPARAADDPAPQQLELFEEKIKAGLVYNFLKYTNWPPAALAQSKGQLHVCLMGDDTSDDYLYPLQGRTAQQYTIMIRRVNAAAETVNCSVLIIHHNHEDDLPGLFAFLKGKHILTISDIDQFAEQGGMVEFSKENEQVGLLVNKQAVDSAGLTIQSRLLKLARLIHSPNG